MTAFCALVTVELVSQKEPFAHSTSSMQAAPSGTEPENTAS